MVNITCHSLVFVQMSNKVIYTNMCNAAFYLITNRRDLVRNFANIHFVRSRGRTILNLPVFATKNINAYLKYEDVFKRYVSFWHLCNETVKHNPDRTPYFNLHFTTNDNEYATYQPILTSLTILLARLFKMINCSTHRRANPNHSSNAYLKTIKSWLPAGTVHVVSVGFRWRHRCYSPLSARQF